MGKKIYSTYEYRLKKILRNINLRCNYPGTNGYEYYGGKGIKNFLTLDDLDRLWQRDHASEMLQPSIHRFDSWLDYKFTNCCFLELSANRRTTVKTLCELCGKSSRSTKCGPCKQIAPCRGCGKAKPRGSRSVYCSSCRRVSRVDREKWLIRWREGRK